MAEQKIVRIESWRKEWAGEKVNIVAALDAGAVVLLSVPEGHGKMVPAEFVGYIVSNTQWVDMIEAEEVKMTESYFKIQKKSDVHKRILEEIDECETSLMAKIGTPSVENIMAQGINTAILGEVEYHLLDGFTESFYYDLDKEYFSRYDDVIKLYNRIPEENVAMLIWETWYEYDNIEISESEFFEAVRGSTPPLIFTMDEFSDRLTKCLEAPIDERLDADVGASTPLTLACHTFTRDKDKLYGSYGGQACTMRRSSSLQEWSVKRKEPESNSLIVVEGQTYDQETLGVLFEVTPNSIVTAWLKDRPLEHGESLYKSPDGLNKYHKKYRDPSLIYPFQLMSGEGVIAKGISNCPGDQSVARDYEGEYKNISVFFEHEHFYKVVLAENLETKNIVITRAMNPFIALRRADKDHNLKAISVIQITLDEYRDYCAKSTTDDTILIKDREETR